METLEKEANPVTKRFDRHAQMNGHKRSEILSLINDLDHVEEEDEKYISPLENYLYGLFDGYFYETNLGEFVKLLKERGYKGLSIRVGYIISDISKYTFNS